LNRTHQLLAYAHDVNLLGDNIGTINKNAQTLIDAIKEVGPEVNVEKTKYMLVSRDQNAFRKHTMGRQRFPGSVVLSCNGRTHSNARPLVHKHLLRRT
jgi:hypothetical protein